MATTQTLRSTDHSTIVITDRDYERLTDLIRSYRVRNDINGSLGKLTQELHRAVKVRAEDVESTIVTMNSTVKLEELRTGRERTLTLVYPQDADINQMKISILTPSSIVLLGCKVGDIVEWPAPIGTVAYIVKKIVYQPEAARDFHL